MSFLNGVLLDSLINQYQSKYNKIVLELNNTTQIHKNCTVVNFLTVLVPVVFLALYHSYSRKTYRE